MPLLSLLTNALAALGRRSAPAVAASVFVGLAAPPLAALAKPLLVPTILTVLAFAFMRTDLSGSFGLRRAATAGIAIGWIMLVLPLALGFALSFTGEPSALTLALLMQATSPPIMSAPAVALLLGLDARLVLVVMVGSMILTPLTTPWLVALFSHGALALDAVGLAFRLALVMGGTAAAGLGLRRLIGPKALAGMKSHLDGANVLLLGLLALGLMDGMTAAFFSRPLFMAGLVGLTVALSLCAIAATMLAFRSVGGGEALILGFAAAHRNMSVMIAATGAVLPHETWLYVGAAQFPIYVLPAVFLPLARRLAAQEQGAAR